MKKIILLVLMNSGFMMAQSKPVVTTHGEIVEVRNAMRFQFLKESTGKNQIGSVAFTSIPGLDNYSYTAPATGTLILQANTYSMISGVPSSMGITARSFMRILINNTPIAYGLATLAAAPDSFFPNNTGKDAPETTLIYTQFKVTKGTTYTISVEANTVSMDPYQRVLTYSGTYVSADGTITIPSTIMGTLLIE